MTRIGRWHLENLIKNTLDDLSHTYAQRVVAFGRTNPLQTANKDTKILDDFRTWQNETPVLWKLGLLQELDTQYRSGGNSTVRDLHTLSASTARIRTNTYPPYKPYGVIAQLVSVGTKYQNPIKHLSRSVNNVLPSLG